MQCLNEHYRRTGDKLSSSRLWRAKADAAQAVADEEGVLSALEQLIALPPDDSAAAAKIGQLYLDRGEAQKALARLQPALSQLPTTPWGLPAGAPDAEVARRRRQRRRRLRLDRWLAQAGLRHRPARGAVTDLAAMRDRLRQEVRCRSAAVAQLKEAREQRDADRIALVRAKEAHAGVALERDRLKRQVAAHKRAARSAASTPRSLADVPPRGRFPASSPVVNRRSAAASSDSSYSPGPSPRRRTPVKAGAHHLEPHPLLSGGGGDA